MKNVFIVIITYNSKKWIEKTLLSIENSQYSVQTIVVDNGSTDGSLENLKSRSDLVFIDAKQNLGFGIANNVGINYALKNGADYVFLLNQDAYLKANTIQILVEQAEVNSEYGILSPVHLNGTGTELDLRLSRYINPSACPGFYSDLYFRSFKAIYSCQFINAAAWLVSRECLIKVGGFEPEFFLYGEDSNYLSRLHYHKFKLGLVPGAEILHDREERKGAFNSIGQKISYISYSKAMLLDIRKSFRSAYYEFLKYTFSVMRQGKGYKTLFRFFKLHFRLMTLRQIRQNLKRLGGFQWDNY